MTKNFTVIIIDQDISAGHTLNDTSDSECSSLVQRILAAGNVNLKQYHEVDFGIGPRREFTPIDLLDIIFSAQVINNELVLNGSAFHSLTKFIDSLKELHPND